MAHNLNKCLVMHSNNDFLSFVHMHSFLVAQTSNSIHSRHMHALAYLFLHIELRQLKQRVDILTDKVENIATAIEESQQYSYRHNVKVIAIPDNKPSESSSETTAMCLKPFERLGIEITRFDIDIAHRVPIRSSRSGPRPIMCKLVRRVVREEILKARKDIRKISAADIGLENQSLLAEAQIVEHLTPSVQKFFEEAKKFQRENDVKFCWVKNF